MLLGSWVLSQQLTGALAVLVGGEEAQLLPNGPNCLAANVGGSSPVYYRRTSSRNLFRGTLVFRERNYEESLLGGESKN